jgi:hypothetical protein
LENWELKIKGILGLQTDIILLSDLRLRRKDGLDVTNKLKAAMLKYSGCKYDLWENSSKKGRGVGILVARDRCNNFGRMRGSGSKHNYSHY